jgi:hypothetical protein
MRRSLFAALASGLCIASPIGGLAADLTLTRSRAIAWLERNQSSDGSWGAAGKKWATTAEALLALAKSGRASSIAAQRAKGWLLRHVVVSVSLVAPRGRVGPSRTRFPESDVKRRHFLRAARELYAYAANNPYVFWDPTGLSAAVAQQRGVGRG